ncbi:hypothetical protein NFI96_020178, partial [Prochilodus magdalenae]
DRVRPNRGKTGPRQPAETQQSLWTSLDFTPLNDRRTAAPRPAARPALLQEPFQHAVASDADGTVTWRDLGPSKSVLASLCQVRVTSLLDSSPHDGQPWSPGGLASAVKPGSPFPVCSSTGGMSQSRPYESSYENLEHPHTVPADGAVGVEVEGHQVFWTCDHKPFILVLTTVPPHTDSLGVSTKTKAGLVTEDDPLPF